MQRLTALPVRATASALALLSAVALLIAPAAAHADGRALFITSARENADQSVATLPLFRGTSHGLTVWYTVADSSDEHDAEARGVNFSQKLHNLVGTSAVQTVRLVNGVVDFPATVHFGLGRVVVAGPTGFPPAQASPGSVGETAAETPARVAYTPYILLPNGIVLNAPHVATTDAAGVTRTADKVVSLNTAQGTVGFRETEGRWADQVIHYLSFDASLDVAAALEDATFAPAMNAAPGLGVDDPHISARAPLAAFTNGQTGANNPQRQGLSSAILDGLSPLNVIDPIPGDDTYSPLWDIHLATWTPAAVASHANTRQAKYDDVVELADHGMITAPDGTAFKASGFIVNCPPISIN